jgi:Protein of unknown function (DUF3168)
MAVMSLPLAGFLNPVHEPSLAVQATIYKRLNAETLAQNVSVPVIDKSGRPELFPCVIIGDAQTMFPDYVNDFHTNVSCDLHIWTAEDNLASAKMIASRVREALWKGPWTVEGHRCVNLRIDSARFLRDPDGLHAHAVLTVSAILQELAQPK